MRLRTLTGLWVMAVFSCHIAGGLDEITFVDDLGCVDAVDCSATECQIPVCEEGACGVVNLEEGELCNGGFCDGEGGCLACLEDDDCDSERCRDDRCVSATCTNGTKDGDETDVDCGGEDCPPCDVDQECEDGSDCVGGKCDDSKCLACDKKDSCEGQQFCDEKSGACVPRKPAGASCADKSECLEDFDCKAKVCTG